MRSNAGWGLTLAVWVAASVVASVTSSGRAQDAPPSAKAAKAADEPGTRERQAAAEAYDKGSTAYLAGEYAPAAKWFETAHRMAPNRAALLQATRAYEHAENLPRAATLALQIVLQYSEDAEAVAYAQGLIDELMPYLVRINVDCDGCRLELESKLLEHTSFFIEPGKKHRLIAEFDTGRRTGDIYGDPGMTQGVHIDAPAAGAAASPPVDLVSMETQEEPAARKDRGEKIGSKRFGPLVTWIGVGVTGACVALSVLSTLDMYGGVGDYEDAATAATDCMLDCAMREDTAQGLLEDTAKGLLEDGQRKEDRTTILWIATGGAAVVTAGIALFLTDWSGGSSDKATLHWHMHPLADGAAGVVEGRF